MAHIEFTNKSPNPELPNVLDVAPQELFEKRGSVKIIDVRRPDEYTGELGHIANAELIVLDTLPAHLPDLNAEDTIVFVCRSGARSGRAAAFAAENGFAHVYNMQGGMLRWNELKLPVEERNG